MRIPARAARWIALVGAAMFALGLFAFLAPAVQVALVLLPIGGALTSWGLFRGRVRPGVLALAGGTIVGLALGWTAYYSWIVYPSPGSCTGGCLLSPPLLDTLEFWAGLFVAILGVAIVLVGLSKQRVAQQTRSPEAQVSTTLH